MDVTLALLADYANVSREGKLNILGIFNQLRASQVPVQHPSMQLVMQFEVAAPELNRDHMIEIQCMGPDGEEVFKLEGSFVVQGDPTAEPTKTINHVIGIQNLTFKEFGGHTFSIFLDNDLKHQVSVEVVEIPPEAPALPGT